MMIAIYTLCILSGTAAGTASAQEQAWRTQLRDVSIPMRDGQHLAANVLLPEEAGAYPAILVQTPYNKDRMGREVGDVQGGSEVGRGSQKAWAQFDREHYAYVFVDWRGFFASKDAMRGVQKRTYRRGLDGYDCVEWVGKQSWCNGKVGTWGGSALGKQQFSTAAEKPPHLVCCVPLIAYQGGRYEGYYEGGVQLEAHTKALDFLGFGVGRMVTENPIPGTLLWNFYRQRTYDPSAIEVPCLMIAGWWDNYPRDVMAMYSDLVATGGNEARSGSKLIMGPWSHTAIDVSKQGDLEFPAAESFSTQATLAFFDFYLRGVEDGPWQKLPRVSAFQTQEERWVGANAWQELEGKAQKLFLTADGGIARDRPGKSAERTYTYDPNSPTPSIGGRNLAPLTHGPKDVTQLLRRGDLLAYQTPALAEPLRTRGEIKLTLSFRCNRVDTDLHVRLCDTYPDGRTYLVREAIQRAKLRDGRRVQELKPAETCPLTLAFDPHAYTWQEGHRLTVVLTGGSWPRYERNPHNGKHHWDAENALDVTVTVLHGKELSPELVVPVVSEH